MRPELENFTPWPHVMFERADVDDRRLLVLTLQGTFKLKDRMERVEEQPPVQLADAFRGDPKTTSLKRAGVLATRKPNSDVTVDAVARSPEPRRAWMASLQLGQLRSDLQIRGPHAWTHRSGSWQLTEPEPCTEVPLTYEKAFGGGGDLDGEWVEEPRNPLGTGFIPDGLRDHAARRAPQVVAPHEPAHTPGETYAPRGWAPLPGYFAPRKDHVGTCDETWRRERFPRPPADFDDAFYQAAHPDLIYPGYLRGDEPLRVEGVTDTGETIESRLPGWLVFALVRIRGGRIVTCPAQLDHVHLDLTAPHRFLHRAHLTWRVVLPKAPELWRIEARMMPMSQLRREAA